MNHETTPPPAILILYSSDYRGHTLTIARAMAEAAGADLAEIGTLGSDLPDLTCYDLIGLGSGVYREDLSSRLYQLIRQLEVRGTKTFVFSTSGVGLSRYNRRLIHQLKKRGSRPCGSFACKGSFASREFTRSRLFTWFERSASGHPDARDLQRARAFISRVVETL